MYWQSPGDQHNGANLTPEYSHSPDYSKMPGWMCDIAPGTWLIALQSEQSDLFTTILVNIDGWGLGWVIVWKRKTMAEGGNPEMGIF